VKSSSDSSVTNPPHWTCVEVRIDDGIAWVSLNRPEKRNAMNPTLNREMCQVLDVLEEDERCQVLVLTGAGNAFSAGMDLKEYFRDTDRAPMGVQIRVRRESNQWQWKRLMMYSKPTIAMVNGWCFGGAFTPLVACDLAIADEAARFGLSEINWGIPPGSVVSRALAATIGQRQALYYIMTGEPFDGKKAAAMGLVNSAVPASQLLQEVRKLAATLKNKNPVVLRAAKIGFRVAKEMPWEQAEDYLYAKLEQSQFLDPEHGRENGLSQFLDDKSFRPGLSTYERTPR
jgi:trans-feruloyl-CoA hydratase/vanillin synthase